MQQWWISGFMAIILLMSGTAHAATLDVPSPHTTLSGIGVIHGWKCEAGELTVRFDGGDPLPLVYGSERQDVLDAGACDHADVGFVSIMNWGNLGHGQHIAVVYDDGVEFDRSTFNVVTTGEAFLEGVAGQCTIEDFSVSGEDARFVWNQSTQHLELAEVRNSPFVSPPTAQERPDLYAFIEAPRHITQVDWHWEKNGLHYHDSIEIDFTIHTNVPDWSDSNGLYLMLAHSRIAGTGFYFGLQTDVYRPGVGGIGKGVIFSRWETRDLSNARLASNGFAQSSGHEGDFIGVRRPYAWSAGTYRARLTRYDSDSQGDWFGLWITDTTRERTTWIGALRFPRLPAGPAQIPPHFTSIVEVYGRPIRPIHIPALHVSITAPLGDGDSTPIYADTIYPNYPYDDEIRNKEIRYQADENAVHMRVGGWEYDPQDHPDGYTRYWLPAVE